MTDARTLLDFGDDNESRCSYHKPDCTHYCEDGHVTADEMVQVDMERIAAAAEAGTLRQRVAELEGTLRALHGIASSHGARTGHDLSCTAADCYVLASLAIRAALTPTPDR